MGRNARKKQERKMEQYYIPSEAEKKLVEGYRQWKLPQIRKKYGEWIPSLPKNYYAEFEPALIRQACLEYWEIHNFNWQNYYYAKLNFKPIAAKDFLLSDFPGDIASALSTQAFEGWYQSSLLPIADDKQVEILIRRFCYVVCGLGKAMQIMSKESSGSLWGEDLFVTALILTGCHKEGA
jgi:hypothetical protein